MNSVMISWGGLRMVRIEKQSMNRMDQDSPCKKPSHFVFTFKHFFPDCFCFKMILITHWPI